MRPIQHRRGALVACGATLAALACSAPPPLEDFELVLHVPEVDVPSEPRDFSGVDYHPETRTLFVVDNKRESVYELDLRGRLLREIEGKGFDDVEGIAHLGGDAFALVEEKRVGIALVTIPRDATSVERAAATLIEPRRGTGIEGASYDAKRGLLYVVNEKKPMEVYSVGRDGSTRHLERVTRAAAQHVTDLAGVHYSPARRGRLLLLSHESNRLVEVTLGGRVVGVLDLPGIQIEGIAFTPDGREFFVVGEPRELFHYRAPPPGRWDWLGPLAPARRG